MVMVTMEVSAKRLNELLENKRCHEVRIPCERKARLIFRLRMGWIYPNWKMTCEKNNDPTYKFLLRFVRTAEEC
jgi:hypothetical protein